MSFTVTDFVENHEADATLGYRPCKIVVVDGQVQKVQTAAYAVLPVLEIPTDVAGISDYQFKITVPDDTELIDFFVDASGSPGASVGKPLAVAPAATVDNDAIAATVVETEEFQKLLAPYNYGQRRSADDAEYIEFVDGGTWVDGALIGGTVVGKYKAVKQNGEPAIGPREAP